MYLSEQPLPTNVLRPYTGGNTVVIYKGYVQELCPTHPKANFWGYVAQHRLVYERHHGRYLNPRVDLHHLNRDKADNRVENLRPCTRSEHMALHRAEWMETRRLPLNEKRVREVLLETKNLKKAAAILHCHTMTLRNRFPDLVKPYKRRSPSQIDHPKVVQQIRVCALNPKMGFRETAQHCGIHWQTVRRICEKNQIVWVRKSKLGEIHKQYRRRKATRKA